MRVNGAKPACKPELVPVERPSPEMMRVVVWGCIAIASQLALVLGESGPESEVRFRLGL